MTHLLLILALPVLMAQENPIQDKIQRLVEKLGFIQASNGGPARPGVIG